MSDKISYLMTIYKEPLEWIKKSINSVLNQKVSNDFHIELIVIIDNPNIGKDIVNFLDSIEYAEFNYYINEENIGLAKSLNKARNLASGIYLARLDADDFNHELRTIKQYEYINNNTEVDLLGSGITKIDLNENKLGESILSDSFLKLKKDLGYKSICYHPTWFMKSIVFDSINGYRPYPNSQDLDFIIRAVENGFIVSNVTDPLVYYRLNENSLSIKNSLRQRKCQNHILKMRNIRMKNMNDNYNELAMLKQLKSGVWIDRIHNISQRILLLSSKHKYKNKSLYFMLLILSSILSPYQFLHFYRVAKRKLIK